ncbi:hypothetical protein D3C86_1311350 [compost metagenome]
MRKISSNSGSSAVTSCVSSSQIGSSPLAKAWARAANWSTSLRWRWVFAAYSATNSGNRFSTSPSSCCTVAPGSTLFSSTRLSRFSMAQASSPSTSARTMRPLPLRVWKARRNSLKAERLSGLTDQRGKYSRRISRTSSVSSRNTSRNSSSTGSSPTGGGNRLPGVFRAGGFRAETGLASTSARVWTMAGASSSWRCCMICASLGLNTSSSTGTCCSLGFSFGKKPSAARLFSATSSSCSPGASGSSLRRSR